MRDAVRAYIAVRRWAHEEEKKRQKVEEDRWYQEDNRIRKAREELIRTLSPASKRDWKRWLTGFLSRGGRITHVYDYPFPQDQFFVATIDCRLPEPGLFGANSLNIIVADGVRVHGNPGHCNIYHMDHYRVEGLEFVPLHADVKV